MQSLIYMKMQQVSERLICSVDEKDRMGSYYELNLAERSSLNIISPDYVRSWYSVVVEKFSRTERYF